MKRSECVQIWYIGLGIIISIIGLGFLGLTACLAYRDMNASASICGAVAFACLIVCRLDYLEVFELLGLKAKFREQVSQADAVILALKKFSVTVASLQMKQMVSTDASKRSWRRIKTEFDELEADVSALGIEGAALGSMKAPVLRAATFDMAMGVHRVIVSRYTKAVAKPGRDPESPDQALASMDTAEFVRESTDAPEFLARLRDVLANPLIPADDQTRILRIIEKVERLTSEMWRDMRLSKEVVEFLSSFRAGVNTGDRSLHDQIFVGAAD